MLNKIFKIKQSQCVSCFKNYIEDTYPDEVMSDPNSDKFFHDFKKELVNASEDMSGPFYLKIGASKEATLEVIRESLFVFSKALSKTLSNQKVYELFDFLLDDPDTIAIQFMTHLNKDNLNTLTSYKGPYKDSEGVLHSTEKDIPLMIRNYTFSQDMNDWVHIILQKQYESYLNNQGGIWFVNIEQAEALMKSISKDSFISSRVSVLDFRSISSSDGFADRTGRKKSLPLAVFNSNQDNISFYAEYLYRGTDPLVEFGKNVFKLVCNIKKNEVSELHVDEIGKIITLKNVVDIALKETTEEHKALKEYVFSQDWINLSINESSKNKDNIGFNDLIIGNEKSLYEGYGYSIMECIFRSENLTKRISSYARSPVHLSSAISKGEIIIAIHEDTETKEPVFTRHLLNEICQRVKSGEISSTSNEHYSPHVSILSGTMLLSDDFNSAVHKSRKYGISLSFLNEFIESAPQSAAAAIRNNSSNRLDIFDKEEISRHALITVQKLKRAQDNQDLRFLFSRVISLFLIKETIRKDKEIQNFGILTMKSGSYLVGDSEAFNDDLFSLDILD